MSEIKSYAPPTCTCSQLPHERDCPVAPFFAEDEALTLDSEQGDYHDSPPFILTCPRGCQFLQFEHAVGYEYVPVQGDTEQTEIPLVCPRCGYSDKQTLPAIVGFDPMDEFDDIPFSIQCPNTSCQTVYTRQDGNISIWLEKEILMGVESAVIRGIGHKKGQVITEYTELSIECSECGHSCGEDDS